MSQQLIPLTRPEKFEAAGLPFETEHAARWAFRQANHTGLSDAFIRIGRRVYIDVGRFHELVRGGHST